MRFEASGGIYGKPFVLKLISEEGEPITLTDGDARKIHTEIMQAPKGPERENVIREHFNGFSKALGEEEE